VKLKWNWGTALFLAMIIFMVFILVFVMISSKQNWDLVEKDYYPKALEYQQKIDKINNAKSLDSHVQIVTHSDYIQFTFQPFFNPDSISGDIYFYRPSDANNDHTYPIALDSARSMTVLSDQLMKGKYLVKIDYSYLNIEYFEEKTLMIKMDQ
jgi:hypothetical protein